MNLIKKITNKMFSNYSYHDISNYKSIERMPYSKRILLENTLRRGESFESDEITFLPSRIIMQDYTGVPAVVDLVTLKQELKELGGNPNKIEPKIPLDLVIDHSIQCDFGSKSKDAQLLNEQLEYKRNKDRYEFLKYASKLFNESPQVEKAKEYKQNESVTAAKNSRFRIFPPDSGIIHQINMEYIAPVVHIDEATKEIYPDSVFGTDSHTTQINALGVLGWGVGGIEAEAALLGEPTSMLMPEIVGVELSGKPKDEVNATDIALTIVESLRKLGVVGKFVEYFGDGLEFLTVPDRATISNMAPEYGATCGYFPVDKKTIEYLEFTGREDNNIQLVETYCKKNSLFYDKANSSKIEYDTRIQINLNKIEPSIAGPTRPQDRIKVDDYTHKSNSEKGEVKNSHNYICEESARSEICDGEHQTYKRNSKSVENGDIVLAAITSCTNTSNPFLLVQAGLFAKNAIDNGFKINLDKIKTTFSPGSKAVFQYLKDSSLLEFYKEFGFDIVGYGCMTCIGNSGPLDKDISEQIISKDLNVVGVLSGNRNFPGRVNPLIKENYLMSPLLVMEFALKGRLDGNLDKFRSLIPTKQEVDNYINKFVTSNTYKSTYQNILDASERWNELDPINYLDKTKTSSYISRPDFVKPSGKDSGSILDIEQELKKTVVSSYSPLAVFEDSITTDHISPAGKIRKDSPAGRYLESLGVKEIDFNSFGARRGNDQVMMRGTFDNIRLQNLLAGDKIGGYSRVISEELNSEPIPIFEVAEHYKKLNNKQIIIGGENYGMGSSRDWAAKGTKMLGVSVVVTNSFERIHRSNLVLMGILPLCFKDKQDTKVLAKQVLDNKTIEIKEISKTGGLLVVGEREYNFNVEVYSDKEWDYYFKGGILPSIVLENL